MIFIIFDIEIIFLFPWAVTYRSMGGYALGVIAEFTIPFVIAFVWLIAQGGLDWGPVRRVRRFVVADVADVVDEGRTRKTTIKRVGLEGRDTYEGVG
jgi:NADH-quinone oxidoreductase subunit A